MRHAPPLGDAAQVRLRLSAQKHARRLVLPRTRERKNSSSTTWPMYVTSSEKRRQTSTSGFAHHLGIGSEYTASIWSRTGAYAETRLRSPGRSAPRDRAPWRTPPEPSPRRADDDVVAAGVVLAKVVDVDPLGARAAPGQRQSLGDDAHAMSACDERIACASTTRVPPECSVPSLR